MSFTLNVLSFKLLHVFVVLDTGATTYNMKRLLLTETARVQTLASKRHMLEEHGPESEYHQCAERRYFCRKDVEAEHLLPAPCLSL
jgi:hypothetical protein